MNTTMLPAMHISVAGDRHDRWPSRYFGFTLIEMMITLVIFSILVALAVPSFNDFVLNTRVKSAASDIFFTLAFARSEAIKRNADIDIVPSGGDWKNGWTVQVASDSTVLKRQDPLESKLDPLALGTVTYGRTGRLTSGADVTFTLRIATNNAVTQRCVTVRASGQPNIQVDNNRDGVCSNG